MLSSTEYPQYYLRYHGTIILNSLLKSTQDALLGDLLRDRVATPEMGTCVPKINHHGVHGFSETCHENG